MDHFSGMHNWYACSHARPTYCNVCREALSGVTSHGLSCEGTRTRALTLTLTVTVIVFVWIFFSLQKTRTKKIQRQYFVALAQLLLVYVTVKAMKQKEVVKSSKRKIHQPFFTAKTQKQKTDWNYHCYFVKKKKQKRPTSQERLNEPTIQSARSSAPNEAGRKFKEFFSLCE